MNEYLPSLAGGILMGLSASMLLLLNGRIAGISGIVGRLAQGSQVGTNAVFVAGLILGPILYGLMAGHAPGSTITASCHCRSSQGYWSALALAWGLGARADMAFSGLPDCHPGPSLPS